MTNEFILHSPLSIMASSAGRRVRKQPLTYDQETKIREDKEQEIQKQKKERREEYDELNEWYNQVEAENKEEEDRLQREMDAHQKEETRLWNVAKGKRDRQLDPLVLDMSAEDQFICDDEDCGGAWGSSDHFSFAFVEKPRSETDKRLTWACKRCDQYHIASRLYSPCATCGKQRFESQYGGNKRFISCSYCGAAKLDRNGLVCYDVL